MFGTRHSKKNREIAKDHRVQNKWTEYVIFVMKHVNRYNQARLVFSVIASTKLALNYLKQVWCKAR